MSTMDFLSSLRERGVRLSVEDGRLKCDAPAGVLDDDLRAQLVTRKQELVALITQAEASLSGPRSLVPLKTSGDAAPLFARPGHNGDVFCYRTLAEYIDPDRPLYGIEPKGLDGSAVPDTVEEIAAYEVEQIRRLQPEGPYHLAGYCACGTVTFESARQLAEDGAEVARIVLFASPFPHVYRTNRGRLFARSVAYRVRKHSEKVASGTLSEGLGYVRERANARVASIADRRDPALDNRRRVESATVEAVKRYDPGYFAGRVDIVLPSEAWRTSGDRPDDWRTVSSRVVEHVGPAGCDGDDMLREPHVRAIAALLDNALDDEGNERAPD